MAHLAGRLTALHTVFLVVPTFSWWGVNASSLSRQGKVHGFRHNENTRMHTHWPVHVHLLRWRSHWRRAQTRPSGAPRQQDSVTGAVRTLVHKHCWKCSHQSIIFIFSFLFSNVKKQWLTKEWNKITTYAELIGYFHITAVCWWVMSGCGGALLCCHCPGVTELD